MGGWGGRVHRLYEKSLCVQFAIESARACVGALFLFHILGGSCTPRPGGAPGGPCGPAAAGPRLSEGHCAPGACAGPGGNGLHADCCGPPRIILRATPSCERANDSRAVRYALRWRWPGRPWGLEAGRSHHLRPRGRAHRRSLRLQRRRRAEERCRWRWRWHGPGLPGSRGRGSATRRAARHEVLDVLGVHGAHVTHVMHVPAARATDGLYSCVSQQAVRQARTFCGAVRRWRSARS